MASQQYALNFPPWVCAEGIFRAYESQSLSGGLQSRILAPQDALTWCGDAA